MIDYSTSVSCQWEYSTIEDVGFDKIWMTVKEIILKNFAGDPVEGVPSPSVQNTIYLSQKDILAAIPAVCDQMQHTKSTKNQNLRELLLLFADCCR